MVYYRRNLFILSITIFLAAISWNQIMPFIPSFLKEMGVSDRNARLQWCGWIATVQPLASIVSMPYWGKLGDKYGRKPMAIRAGLCLACIYYAMSMCVTPWQLLIVRFLNGALTGFIPGSMALIATNTPEAEAPRAMSIAQVAASIGPVAGPFVGVLLASHLGYRGSMRISGAAVLFSTFLVYLLVQEPNRPKMTDKTSMIQDFMIAFRLPSLATVLVTVLISGAFASALSPILPIHLQDLTGIQPPALDGVVARAFSLLSVSFVLSAYAWTYFGERYGFDRAIRIGLTGTAICSALMVTARTALTLEIGMFATGIFLAALGPAVGAIICTRVREDFRGRAYGIQLSANTLGAVIAPFAASQLAGAYGIPCVFVMVAAVYMVGAVLVGRMVRQWNQSALGQG